ncbi:uncharacterized protein LOC126728727 [Quercus robur]|uniref:uncharacterized protein LOC126728727 n=1 Tax=Quercus robur TaxID=38942 RepID=UPI0021629B22|nr:uncharacterized protein LOC126728727 [Quercus robur]
MTCSYIWRKWSKDEVPGKMSVYYVMNPITRKCLELPPITQPRGFFIQAGLIFSYDNNNNNIDDKQLSYSLVLIPYLSHKSRKFKIHMFSSNTSEWSEFEPLLPALEGFELCHFPRSAVSYKGMLFCPGTGGRLLAFDPYNARSCRLIEKSIEYESHGGTDCDYDNEGGGNWFLEHEVFFNQLVSKYVPLKFPFVTVLAFHPNDGDILYLVIEMKVELCNLRSKTMEVFCDIPHGCEGSSTMSGDCTLQSILDDREPNEEDESCVTIAED